MSKSTSVQLSDLGSPGPADREPLPRIAAVRDSATDIRPLMAGFPTGVSIVTSMTAGGRPWGMTCSSLCSVSLEPPVLLVCLNSASLTLEAVRSSGTFAVNLLHAQGRSAAELFASGARDRFDRVEWRGGAGAAGPHLHRAAHTIADCSVISDQTVGDHAVIMGKVATVTSLCTPEPLLYGLRRFSTWSDDSESGTR
ncbi:flavin reductase family protein [Streptomyces sp. NPDC045714]|uniref:flavin reductase family protein n=1 Tax=Streptomyces sp. NPDC045714 TaxID=3154913 RepID=UPI0033F958B6